MLPHRSSRNCFAAFIAVTLVSGCADPVVPPPAAKTGGKSAKLKTTDDIGEFKPDEGKEIVDSKITYSNPITGALEAIEPVKEQLSGLQLGRWVEAFRATEGRYPKDHEEFMTKVIKQNKIRLPKLSPGKAYEYDVENHKLVIVREEPKKK